MAPQIPLRKCSLIIPGLGQADGYEYQHGVRQFCGIPYAALEKRWTRSTLKTWWDNNYHDGSKLGNRCPHPEIEGDDTDELTPVPPFPHFNIPSIDEKSALVMNIVLPPIVESTNRKLPIFVYVHGGSLLYGGANHPIFDAVNFVTQSVVENRPVIAINFNYRVGLGGFLASSAITQELIRDGHSGCGNFGLTDQQVAFQWVQRYCAFMGGDITNVTAVGESAGGISISNQLLAREPPTFHRAGCMSGLAFSIPAHTMEQHQALFDAVCKYFDLDPRQKDVMDSLRQIPEQQLANASPHIFGVASGTGNPCLDGVYYAQNPLDFHEAPGWLKSYMLGDVYHEGVIFHLNIMYDTFGFWRSIFLEHLDNDESVVNQIFQLYDISAEQTQEERVQRFEHMAGDAIFKIPNYLTAKLNSRLAKTENLYLYHFDQRSRIRNSFENTAYHAHDLLFLFKNLHEQMNDAENEMAADFVRAWIDFAYGDESSKPWPPSQGENQRTWKIWGPTTEQKVVSEDEDEEIRNYARFEAMLNIGQPGEAWKNWFMAIDAIVNKRMRLGKGLPSEHTGEHIVQVESLGLEIVQ